MAVIRPLAGIRYSTAAVGRDLSALIAPPYDVLDEAGKQALLARDPRNVVQVDLPHTPPKVAGPDAVYAGAHQTIRQWLADGVLAQDHRACLYPYQQSYDHAGKTYHRRGLLCRVKLSPFGAGDVVPHEKTYDGPIEDRLKLMRATGMQLSPVFGLFSDPAGEVNKLLYHEVSRPIQEATLDKVVNRLWSVHDAAVEAKVIDFFSGKAIYIADGHHRYTTALHYQKEMREKHGGSLPEAHPANYCLFALVPMQDPGLLIHPTHRLLGGLKGFDLARLKQALGANADVAEAPLSPTEIRQFAATLPGYGPHTFGLYCGDSGRLYSIKLRNPDVLKPIEPTHSDAWRSLDVAILQRWLIDEVFSPAFAGGQKLTPGYTADADAILPMMQKGHYQVALLLQPTPLAALESLGRTGEVMPQKSTYFFPKLATGLVISPLE
jgi:uncharacterized protein (DUF1015 family)